MLKMNTHFQRIFLNFGSVLGTQTLGGAPLLALQNALLELSWLQVVSVCDFDSILGSLGRLSGLSWPSLGTLREVFLINLGTL